MTEAERNRATVTRLIDILRGESPIESGADLIAQDVVANVDSWRFEGINVWANWIQYLRTRGRLDALTLFVDQVVAHDDSTVTVQCRMPRQFLHRINASLDGIWQQLVIRVEKHNPIPGRLTYP